MAEEQESLPLGKFFFDGVEFEEYAVDLPPGGCLGMLTEREGFWEVCQELISHQAEWGALAGIADQEITDLTTSNARIARIDVFLPAMLKAVEILTETRYFLDDKRQRIAFDAAQSVDRRAKRNPDLLAKYERTRAYRSAAAKKALKTKAKNAAEAASDATDATSANGQSAPQPQPSAPKTA